jgi:hypothetical protein
MATKKKLVTLEGFVKTYGTQSAAARIIRVHTETLNRWLNKQMVPDGQNLYRLYELGIDLKALGVDEHRIAAVAADVAGSATR